MPGPGRLQKGILALTKSDPDGAWNTRQLCEIFFPEDDKIGGSRYASVARALRKADLPPLWKLTRSRYKSALILVNTGSPKSTQQAELLKGDIGETKGSRNGSTIIMWRSRLSCVPVWLSYAPYVISTLESR